MDTSLSFKISSIASISACRVACQKNIQKKYTYISDTPDVQISILERVSIVHVDKWLLCQIRSIHPFFLH